jgi:hypothetical protein
MQKRRDFVDGELSASHSYSALGVNEKAAVIDKVIEGADIQEAVAAELRRALPPNAGFTDPVKHIRAEFERRELADELRKRHAPELARDVENGVVHINPVKRAVISAAMADVAAREYKDKEKVAALRRDLAVVAQIRKSAASAVSYERRNIEPETLLRVLLADRAREYEERADLLDPLGRDVVEREVLKMRTRGLRKTMRRNNMIPDDDKGRLLVRAFNKLKKRIGILSDGGTVDAEIEVEREIKAFKRREKWRLLQRHGLFRKA